MIVAPCALSTSIAALFNRSPSGLPNAPRATPIRAPLRPLGSSDLVKSGIVAGGGGGGAAFSSAPAAGPRRKAARVTPPHHVPRPSLVSWRGVGAARLPE